ncbi:ATP-dependent helicase [Paenibacillus assamensis]|uniref:ATP-dependent helicase n=1 Tax=Paenibacillus assamensis TaxID=311244 RepID=UPI0004253B91|nr:ATP-dependent helicase [Paenibacillus assamensis]
MPTQLTKPAAANIRWQSHPYGISAQATCPTAESAQPTFYMNDERTATNVPHSTPVEKGLKPQVSTSDPLPDSWFFAALRERGLDLHEAQCAAVRHQHGPLLCLAGAGSGKTSVLTARAAYMIAVHEVPPEALWLVTFTNKAAAEMRSRLARLPGLTPAIAKRVQARTFHSFALTLLKAYAPPFTLLTEERARHGWMSRVLREIGLRDAVEAETVLAALSALKSRGESPSDWRPADEGERNLQRAMIRYEEQKQARDVKDFDDLIVDIVKLLESDAELTDKLRRRFRYVMADEFQDTTPMQLRLLRHIANGSSNLAVFGDDDQTIYTFNGANHEHITQFHRQYPDVTQITLDYNFRSTSPIVGLGNAIIRCNKERLVKTMRAAKKSTEASIPAQEAKPQYNRPTTTDEEAETAIARIRKLTASGQYKLSDIAILYRSAHASRAIVEYMTIQNVPFRQFGAEPLFYEHLSVKTLIDHMRLALHPRDPDALASAVAALYVPKEAGMTYIRQAEKTAAKKYPLVHLATCPGLAPFQQEAIKPRIRYLKKVAQMKPNHAVRDIRREFYDKWLTAMAGERATAYQEGTVDMLEELETSAQRFATIEQFLKHIDDLAAKYAAASTNKEEQSRSRQAQSRQTMQADQQETEPDAVTLMTIHRAKGLEFPCVFVIGASEGVLPHRTALRQNPPAEREAAYRSKSKDREEVNMALVEEERRLMYVAVSRAKEQLYISSPAQIHGKQADVSRFITEAWSNPQLTK